MIDELQRQLDQACAAYARHRPAARGLGSPERHRAAVRVLEVAELLGLELLEQAEDDLDAPIPFRLVVVGEEERCP